MALYKLFVQVVRGRDVVDSGLHLELEYPDDAMARRELFKREKIKNLLVGATLVECAIYQESRLVGRKVVWSRPEKRLGPDED